jgi:hypothetical protein
MLINSYQSLILFFFNWWLLIVLCYVLLHHFFNNCTLVSCVKLFLIVVILFIYNCRKCHCDYHCQIILHYYLVALHHCHINHLACLHNLCRQLSFVSNLEVLFVLINVRLRQLFFKSLVQRYFTQQLF